MMSKLSLMMQQAKFNDAATTNFIRHEDALRVIVNHIKNAE